MLCQPKDMCNLLLRLQFSVWPEYKMGIAATPSMQASQR